ncbi:MAG: MOSC domain-containing protein [Opitutales bacterium]
MPEVIPEILHLFISPGHNYFGHHGREPGKHATLEVDAITCVAGCGIEGDRFFSYKPDYPGQVTFFADEVFQEMCAQFHLSGKSPAVFRRNIITRGADLNGLIGREFEVQGLRFRGTQESKPCYWMNQAFAPGAETALQGRGGLRAEVLSGGVLRRAVLAGI